MKLTKIYTRTGDSGTTSLVGGERIKKEPTLNNDSDAIAICERIERIQNNLFNISTYLATDTATTPVYPSAEFNSSEIIALENDIDTYNQQLPTLDSFILPGGSIPAAQCHVCRTVCRRAERRIVTLISTLPTKTTVFNPDIVRYVNRISDYLFVLARKLNFLCNSEEKIWKNSCK